MKFILFIISIFFVQAQEPRLAGYSCVTEFPTTSYILEVAKSKVTLDVIHHNGIEHAPVFRGIITPNYEKTLRQSREYMTKMGTQFQVEFDIKNCSNLTREQITCYEPKPTKIGSLEVQNYYFTAYKNTNKNIYGEFKDVQVELQYRVKGWGYSIPMEFQERDCQAK